MPFPFGRKSKASTSSLQTGPPTPPLSPATSSVVESASSAQTGEGPYFSPRAGLSRSTTAGSRTSLDTEADKAVLLPPAYALAAYPSVPASYTFHQISPFAMSLHSLTEPGRALYTISIGLNVWMPSATMTYVRRGEGEHGPLVAQLEMGISSASANVTFADECKPLGSVMFRKSAGSNSRYYFTGDGAIVRWKIGQSPWEAYSQSKLLASFDPALPRTLTVQPDANILFDHIVVALLVLMREHLTPLAAQIGDAAGLFNYNSSSSAQGLQNQEW